MTSSFIPEIPGKKAEGRKFCRHLDAATRFLTFSLSVVFRERKHLGDGRSLPLPERPANTGREGGTRGAAHAPSGLAGLREPESLACVPS